MWYPLKTAPFGRVAFPHPSLSLSLSLILNENKNLIRDSNDKCYVNFSLEKMEGPQRKPLKPNNPGMCIFTWILEHEKVEMDSRGEENVLMGIDSKSHFNMGECRHLICNECATHGGVPNQCPICRRPYDRLFPICVK